MQLDEILEFKKYDDGRGLEKKVDENTCVQTDLCFYGSD